MNAEPMVECLAKKKKIISFENHQKGYFQPILHLIVVLMILMIFDYLYIYFENLNHLYYILHDER